MRARRGCPLGAFAVLYRGNHQARVIEMKLRMLKLPYQLSGGTSFYARTEIRDLLGTTRKFAVPLCEYLDRVGVTHRDGDLRRRA